MTTDTEAMRAAIAFLTGADDSGFGTVEMESSRFYKHRDDVVKKLQAALASQKGGVPE